jgi:hypothetical protein
MRSASAAEGSNGRATVGRADENKSPAFVQRALEILRKCSTFMSGDRSRTVRVREDRLSFWKKNWQI